MPSTNSIYFTPGPSQLFETYNKHLQTAIELQLGSINHRSAAFRTIYQHTDEQLRTLLNIPTSHSIFFASSATEIWEKIILNLVETHSFHLTNGAFSSKFYDFAKQLKKIPQQVSVEEGHGFEIETIEIPVNSELICTTQNETSTGVKIAEVDFKLLKQKNATALLCTDLVSSAPYANIDYSIMDCSFFSVQKAFGMPPGLGVWIVNEACLAKAEYLKTKGINIGAHNTLESYFKNYQQFETPSTPNVVAIYILGKIAEDMNGIGIETIRKQIQTKASMIYSFAEKHLQFKALVTKKEHRSDTVVVLNTQLPSKQIIETIKKHNFVLGSGYGKLKESQIRIANFPATTEAQVHDLINLLKIEFKE